jgi:spermidine/putrescine transport system ATP-binding protein
MPKDLKVNHYIGTIDKDGWLELTDGRIPVKEKEPKAHPEDTRLKMYFPSKLAKLSDDPEELEAFAEDPPRMAAEWLRRSLQTM